MFHVLSSRSVTLLARTEPDALVGKMAGAAPARCLTPALLKGRLGPNKYPCDF